MTTELTDTSSANEIRITRIYDAPVSLVWDAWTEPGQVEQWWGPRGFTTTSHSKELRTGGTWVYTMHAPDGTDYPNFVRYLEVEPRVRLVYDHGMTSADARPKFRMTVAFRDMGTQTELDIRMTLPTAEEAQQTKVFVKAAGGYATWDRLAEYLAKEVSSAEVFVISRSFEAPIGTVFDMWTTPAHLAAWLPPAGFTMTFQSAAIRSGGSASFSMTNEDLAMFARHDYLQVRRPDLLEYTQTFTDERGVDSRHPGAPTWPVTTLVTVVFADEGPLQTRATVRFAAVGSCTPEEIATFTAERPGMTLGWNGSFDKLDALLAGAATGATASRS